MQGKRTTLNGQTASAVIQERLRLGLSQRDLAAFGDVAPSTVARCEAGRGIKPANAAKLGSALTAFDLLTGRPSAAELDDRLETLEMRLADLDLQLAKLIAAVGNFAFAAARTRSDEIALFGAVEGGVA